MIMPVVDHSKGSMSRPQKVQGNDDCMQHRTRLSVHYLKEMKSLHLKLDLNTGSMFIFPLIYECFRAKKESGTVLVIVATSAKVQVTK